MYKSEVWITICQYGNYGIYGQCGIYKSEVWMTIFQYGNSAIASQVHIMYKSKFG